MKKNVLFLKKRKIAQKTKTRKKKRGADFGELDFCIPKQNNAEKKRGAQVGVLRVIFYSEHRKFANNIASYFLFPTC